MPKQPALNLFGTKAAGADVEKRLANIVALFRKLTGREPTKDDIEESRRILLAEMPEAAEQLKPEQSS